MKVISWNVGSYYFLKFRLRFHLPFKGVQLRNIYFQPKLTGAFVSSELARHDPDIIFLQEITSLDDISYIPVLAEYPYMQLVATTRHEHSILVAAKQKFELHREGSITLVNYRNVTFIPIHLDAYSPTLRRIDSEELGSVAAHTPHLVILGDTNLWSRGKHCIMPSDKKAYAALTSHLIDRTSTLASTTLFGVGLDKAFSSSDVQVDNVRCPHTRSYFMDHYPLVLTIVEKESV